MEQHPIPQNISSYQFRLVGDMTLKQFFQLAGGAVVSLVTYSLPIYPIIKWPLIIFFSLFGVALAFLPFQERPLEQWIIAFFRSIYTPTVFRWKSVPGEEYFQKETIAPQAVPVQAPTTKSQPLNIPFVSSLEETEGKFLSKLADLFNTAPAPVPAMATAAPMESVYAPSIANAPGYNTPATPTPVGAPPELNIPEMGDITVPKRVVEERLPVSTTPSGPLTMSAVGQTLTGEGMTASQMAQFSVDAAPPSLPTITNTISGQVMDPEGKIIEGAILEIRDSGGRSVRALRSNKVGHFLTVTPLLNGRYELITDKDGFIFDPVIIDTKGEIIQPIAVRARARNVSTQVIN